MWESDIDGTTLKTDWGYFEQGLNEIKWYCTELESNVMPSADRPQGEWIGEADGYADGELVYDTWYCSNCGYVADDEEPPTWNYCPNCGCYNGGGQSEND